MIDGTAGLCHAVGNILPQAIRHGRVSSSRRLTKRRILIVRAAVTYVQQWNS
jgi:hypothetical protein